MKSFKQYDNEHPQIYVQFRRITLELIASGRGHYGAKAIFEVIRFRTITGETGYPNRAFKINNNFAPDYARKFEKEYPQYEGFFRKRQLKKVRG